MIKFNFVVLVIIRSDVEQENARLKRELKDTQDALETLKKNHQHSGRMTIDSIPSCI